jgi:hypothetical protein
MNHEKDTAVNTLVEKLKNDISNPYLEFIDHWDSDDCAIGLGSSKEPDKLVYISTYNRKSGCYYFEFEIGNIGSGESETTEKGNDVIYSYLLEKILLFLVTLR